LPLFKYMSVGVAPLFAKNLRVRFTQPFELNDPFEFRPMLDFVGTADDVRPVVEARIDKMYGTLDGAFAMMEKQLATDPTFAKVLVAPLDVLRKIVAGNPTLQQQFIEAMQQHKADLLDNTRMAPMWEAEWEKFRQALGQTLGIFSLTEDPANILMWSHYGSQHFGVVVEFDEKHPWFNQRTVPSDDLRHLVKVAYVQNPHPRTWKQVNGTDMLYTKTSDWSYEREWRMIRPLKDGAEVSSGIFCFEVPAEVVRGITLGCRTKPALETEIRAAINSNPALAHVQFKRAKLGGDKIETVDAT
jgi:hypothetical protein